MSLTILTALMLGVSFLATFWLLFLTTLAGIGMFLRTVEKSMRFFVVTILGFTFSLALNIAVIFEPWASLSYAQEADVLTTINLSVLGVSIFVTAIITAYYSTSVSRAKSL